MSRNIHLSLYSGPAKGFVTQYILSLEIIADTLNTCSEEVIDMDHVALGVMYVHYQSRPETHGQGFQNL